MTANPSPGSTPKDERGAGLAFARVTRVTYPLAIANVQVWSAYCVSALPATFFVSAQGRILGADFGGMARSSLLHLVRQLFHVNPP